MTLDTSRRQSLSRLLEMGFEREAETVAVSDSVRVDRRTHKVSAARPAMGTLVSISALADTRQRAEDAIGRAFQEMDRLIGIFSRFESASALSQLNDAGRLPGPPRELVHVVSRALHYHRVTRGVFDISVAPVLDLFRDTLGGAAPASPSEAQILEAAARVGARHISASKRELRFGKEGMGITLDGIAKGYIVDRMAEAVAARRVRGFLINAGGDIRADGRKEGRQPWSIGVRDPSGGSRFPDRIHLTRGAVATSGSYEIYFDRDRLFHHIVMPAAGRSPTDSVSVSALAPTAIAADALATSLFIMAPAEALAFVESLAGCECLIIDRTGRALRSRGWKSAAPVNPQEVDGP